MEFNFGNSRPRVTQPVIQFNRIIRPAEGAIPVSETLNESRLVTTFIISNYSTAANSVFLSASQNLHASIEIVPGAAPMFEVRQEGRQLYELQILVMKMTGQQARDLIQVPVMCWDLTQWWLGAAGDTPIEVAITAFPLPYL